MIGLLKYAKLGGLWVLSIVVVAAFVWMFRGQSKDREWENRIRDARPDTVRMTDTVWLPGVASGGVTTAKHLSIALARTMELAKLLAMERDSLRLRLEYLLEPKEITLESDEIGKLLVRVYPSSDPFKPDSVTWSHLSPPRAVIENTVTVTKEVIVEKSNFWGYVETAAITAGVVYITIRMIEYYER